MFTVQYGEDTVLEMRYRKSRLRGFAKNVSQPKFTVRNIRSRSRCCRRQSAVGATVRTWMLTPMAFHAKRLLFSLLATFIFMLHCIHWPAYPSFTEAFTDNGDQERFQAFLNRSTISSKNLIFNPSNYLTNYVKILFLKHRGRPCRATTCSPVYIYIYIYRYIYTGIYIYIYI